MSEMDAEPGTSKECEKENVPAVLNGELFVIKSTDGNKITAQCELCNAKHKKTMIKGAINATSNFRLHLKVKRLHPIEFKKFAEKSIKFNRKKRKVANEYDES
ncbi:PREDICTED: uncharacterized protein LOC105569564, partial [Vollenhovia emeryi]|uniref:uncharacterized protein LOC105569564 n=1 Tax=Vollenhovia emeryi TaxID=411798 RepID=UPI0005F4040C